MNDPKPDPKIDQFLESEHVMANVPTKAAYSHLYWAREANQRANTLQEQNVSLRNEVRDIAEKNAALEERLRSLDRQRRLIASVSSVLIAFAGITAAIALYSASLNPPQTGLTWTTGGLSGLLLLGGVGVNWLPFGRPSD